MDSDTLTTYLDLDRGVSYLTTGGGDVDTEEDRDNYEATLNEEENAEETPIDIYISGYDDEEEGEETEVSPGDPLEPEVTPVQPSTSSSKVARLNPPAPPKFSTKEDFTSEMDTSIKNIINESVLVLHRDPREYHPFYLRVYKFTTLGQNLGFLTSEKEVDSLWKKYDSLAVTQFTKWQREGDFQQFDSLLHSPYLTFILTKNVWLNGKLISVLLKVEKKRAHEFVKAAGHARRLRRRWAQAGISNEEIRSNLKYRLQFFQHVKHFSYPGDVNKMNKCWTTLLNGHIKDRQEKEGKPPVEGKRSGRQRRVPSRYQVERDDGVVVKVEVPDEEIPSETNAELPMTSTSRRAIDGGQCSYCGKTLTWQLARHIREVHLKVRPTKRKKERGQEEEEVEGYPALAPPVVVKKSKPTLKNLTEEERKEYWKQWGQQRRANRTAEEIEEERQRLRERYYWRVANMTPEEREEKRQRNRFQQLQRRIEKEQLPDEERERLKTINFVKNQAYLAKKDKEWKAEKLAKAKERQKGKRERMTEEERERERQYQKDYRKNLTGEKLARYKENVKQCVKRYFDKVRKNKYQEGKGHQWGKVLQYQRNRVQNETQEQREARLLRYRINQGKRRAREQLEKEGASVEEIERRLKEVEEEIRSQPRSKKESEYKPRIGARKPHNVPTPTKQKRSPTKDVKPSVKKEGYVGIERGTLPAEVPTPENQKLEVAEVHSRTQIHPLLLYQQQPVEIVTVPPQPPQSSHQVLYTPFREVTPTAGQTFTIEFDTSTPTPSLQLVQYTVIPSTVAVADAQGTTHMDSFEESPCAIHGGGGGYNGGAGGGHVHVVQSAPMATPPQIFILSTIEAPSQEQATSSEVPLPVPVSISLPPTESYSSFVQTTSMSSAALETVPTTSLAILSAAVSAASEVKQPESEIPPLPELTSKGQGHNLCDECGKTFTTVFSVQLHKNVMHGLDSLVCPKCQQPCTSTVSLWNHFAKYHLEDVDLLPKEHFPASQREPPPPGPPKPKEPYKQIRGDPNSPQYCPTCGKSFTQKCTLDDHIRRVHQGKGHYCDVCNRDQQSAAKLWRHKLERHGLRDLAPPPGIPLVACKFCGEKIMRGYEQHVKKHHPENYDEFKATFNPEKGTAPQRHKKGSVQCPHCPSVVKSRLLNRHIKHIHTPDKPKFPCPECGFQFKRQDHMKKHYREHHSLADIERKLEAKQFIKVHSYRSFSATCLLCKKDIVSKQVIRAHFVKEHHEIFLECQVVNLAIFKCGHCEDKFSKEGELRKHVENKHPDNLLTCQICGVFKFTEADLLVHEQKHRQLKLNNLKRHGKCVFCEFDASFIKSEDNKGSREEVQKAIREHVKSQHPDNFFPCPHPNCTRFCVSHHSLQTHMSKCTHSGGHFQLESKQFVESTVNPLVTFCPTCRKPCKLGQLEKHRKREHDWETEQLHCEQCDGRVYKCQRFYIAHMNQVHGVPFEKLLDLVPEDIKPERNPKTGRGGRPPKVSQKGGRVVQRKKRGRPGKKKNVESDEDFDEEMEVDDTSGVEEEEDKWSGPPLIGTNIVKQEVVRRRPGPKSKTQGRLGTGGEVRGSRRVMEMEKEKRLVVEIERMSDDLTKYYMARRIFVKIESEWQL